MKHSKGLYKNEVEMPEIPMDGKMEMGWGCDDMKGDADPIVFGQAAEAGCSSDSRKMHAQFKNYHWA